MLDLTQILSFEISTECNLKERHKDICPIGKRPKGARVLTDEIIVNTTIEAHNLGFSGMVAFHFYNEPMVHHTRMFNLMDEIRYNIPQSRFLLWTNGTILIKDPHLAMFEKTYVSNYFKTPAEELLNYFNGLCINNGGEDEFDDRLLNRRGPKNFAGCGLAVHDFTINNSGDVHLCCLDWMNEVKIGNIFDTGIEELTQRKLEIVKTIWKQMDDKSPERCLTCCHRFGLGGFDSDIQAKAIDFYFTL